MSDTGYKQQQLEAGSNIAKAQLNLQFKPWFKPSVNNSNEEESTITFNGIKVGQTSTVKILFRANPKPNGGQWIMGDTIIPIGKNTFSIIKTYEKSELNSIHKNQL